VKTSGVDERNKNVRKDEVNEEVGRDGKWKGSSDGQYNQTQMFYRTPLV